ncbi:MAG: sulfite exporter TauE/SafE family protein [Bacteroidia bacterium]
MSFLLGYFCALLVGVTLGLLGGGGAILAIPVMVYLMSIQEMDATGYSLFIVGMTSLVGAWQYVHEHQRQRNKIFRTAFVFAPASILMGILTRYLVKNYLPNELYQIGSFHLEKGLLIMLILGIVLMVVSKNMIAPKDIEQEEICHFSIKKIAFRGGCVGLLAGLVCSGGGFLITPVLVKYLRFPMRLAIGTSLVIICLNSWFMFIGDLVIRKSLHLPWTFLLSFSGISVIGVFIGNYLSHHISSAKLKPVFGYFVLILGAFILTKELIF